MGGESTLVLDPWVALLVLAAALMHATWNAIIKSDRDRLATFAVVMISGTVLAMFFVPFVAFPSADAWPFLIASMVVHVFYYFFLLRAYTHGDLSHVYPIARGLGPLLVAALSGRLVGEYLSVYEITGVALVCLGIGSLALTGGAPGKRGTLYAIATGLTIAAYTLVDGLGVRAANDALSYIVWLNILEGPWVMIVAVAARRSALLPYLRVNWWRGAIGGTIATLGYAIAMWAMTVGAIAHVAVLRETSVLFAAVMGAVLLGESFGPRRIAAAGLVVAGLIALNLPLILR
jgi:drug/metabolite transporter (DMT)-like permease